MLNRRTRVRNSVAALPRLRMVECWVERLPQFLANLGKVLAEVEPTFPSAAELGYRAVSAST